MPRFTKEQQEAIDKEGCNILVSAGAGSGKTAVLSQRVLRKVKEGVSVDDLLILTFTNAAAAEMKERIRDLIKEEDNLEEEVLKVDSAYITTFDAFTLSLVKKHHYLKDLPKSINICDASILSLKKEEILENLFEELYQERNETFVEFIKTYFIKNDKDLFQFILNFQKSLDLIYEKEEFINSFADTYFGDDKVNLLIDEYFNIIKNSLNIVREFYDDILRIDDEYASKLNIKDLLKATSYENIKAYANVELPRLKSGSSEELKEAKENIKKSLDNLKVYLIYETLEEYKVEYLSTKKFALEILKITDNFDKRVKSMKLKENIFDFLDIEKFAIDILRENKDVREYYKEKFNEILIDEYQDTSDIQEYFTDLIAKNNVYMVGDIKQSIYRFRNANPDIFKDKFINYGNSINGKRIDLNKNFRSREEVLLDINLMFDKIMDIPIGGANYKEEHRLVFGNTSYNEDFKNENNNNFEIYNYKLEKDYKFDKEEVEIFKIAEDIKNKVDSGYIIFDKEEKCNRPAIYSDFAILLDRGTSFFNYKKVFEFLNIPLSILKDESIKSADMIKIMKNIFVLIKKIKDKEYDTDFKYAYFSVARSFLIKESDSNLFDIIINGKFFDTLVYKKCFNISDGINTKTIYEIFLEVIDEFNMYENIISLKNIDTNNVILEYLVGIAKNVSTLYTFDEFINYLDNIINGKLDLKYEYKKDDECGVSLMTIHKSKGLQFPVCYFAGLDKPFNIRELSDKFLFNKKYGIVIPAKNKVIKNTFVKDLYINSYILDEVSEKLRLLYVALPRAKEKMIFVMSIKNEKDYTYKGNVVNDNDRIRYRSFADVLESINKVIVPYSSNIDLEKLYVTDEYKFTRKNNHINSVANLDKKLIVNENIMKDEIITKKHFSKESKELFDKETKSNINEGLYIHSVMENLNFANPDFSVINNNYISYVKKFLNLDILNNAVNIYKEYEFMYFKESNEMHGIIDLLIEKEDKFVIIDYKLKNITSDDYINQLNGYKNYIKAITGKNCEIYLYSFIDGLLVNLEKN